MELIKLIQWENLLEGAEDLRQEGFSPSSRTTLNIQPELEWSSLDSNVFKFN